MTNRVVLILVTALTLTGCTSPSTKSQAPQKPTRDDFDKKLKCAAMLDKLQESAEHDQFQSEAYVRTFYSPHLNACLAEKYTLHFPDNKVPESMQVIDLSSNRTVWTDEVPCQIRPTGQAQTNKYTCSDYYWNVEKQLDDYVKSNHLEDAE